MYKANYQASSEVVLPDFSDDETTTTTNTKSRRVSFGTNFVKEFIVGSAVSAQCVSEYEEAFLSSDSSNTNSSHSIIDNSKSNQNTFVVEENHTNQKLISLNAPASNSKNLENVAKISKFSSTICFSADSPTADLEFTGGCINLAKNILKKKNQEMTVIISSKPKAGKDNFKSTNETIYFEGSEIDMSMTNFIQNNESRKEDNMDTNEIKIFDESDTMASKLFKTRTPNVTNYNSDMSLNDSLKVNKLLNDMPINMIMHQLDSDDSDLEESLFHPKKSFNDVLNSGPFNVSIDIENSSGLNPLDLKSNESSMLQNNNTIDESPTPSDDLNDLLLKSAALHDESLKDRFSNSEVIKLLEESQEPQSLVKNIGVNDSTKIFNFGNEFSMDKSLGQQEETESRMEMDSFISQEQILAVEREMTMEIAKYGREPIESEHEMSMEETQVLEFQQKKDESVNISCNSMKEIVESENLNLKSFGPTELKITTQNLVEKQIKNGNHLAELQSPDKIISETGRADVFEDVEMVSSDHLNLVDVSKNVEPTEKNKISENNLKSVHLNSDSIELETSNNFGKLRAFDKMKVTSEIENLSVEKNFEKQKNKDNEKEECMEIPEAMTESENHMEKESKDIIEDECNELETFSKQRRSNAMEHFKEFEKEQENIMELETTNLTGIQAMDCSKSFDMEVDNKYCSPVKEFEEVIRIKKNEFNQNIEIRKKDPNCDVEVKENKPDEKIENKEKEERYGVEREGNEPEKITEMREKSLSCKIEIEGEKSDKIVENREKDPSCVAEIEESEPDERVENMEEPNCVAEVEESEPDVSVENREEPICVAEVEGNKPDERAGNREEDPSCDVEVQREGKPDEKVENRKEEPICVAEVEGNKPDERAGNREDPSCDVEVQREGKPDEKVENRKEEPICVAEVEGNKPDERAENREEDPSCDVEIEGDKPDKINENRDEEPICDAEIEEEKPDQIFEVEENKIDQNLEELQHDASPSFNIAKRHNLSLGSENFMIVDKSIVTPKNVKVDGVKGISEKRQAENETISGTINDQKKLDGKEIQEENSQEPKKIKLDEKRVEKENVSKNKEPPPMNQKVLENLKDQSKEPDCMWQFECVEYGVNSCQAEWTFRFRLLESYVFAHIRLQESEAAPYSDVKSVEIQQKHETKLRRKEYLPILEFGFEKLRSLVEQEQKIVKNVLNVPYFLDRVNFFGSKLNRYLEQMYAILTMYPGSRLSGSLLSFRLFSFPLFFSVTVFIDLADLYGLSKSSLTFDVDLGTFDKKEISIIFENCLEFDNSLTEFVIRSTEYLIKLEKETGRITRRNHIRLLPSHFN